MTDAELRIGVIGAGRHSMMRVLPTMACLSNARLVSICDLDGARAMEAARRYSIQTYYTDYHEMINCTHPDAVIICVGPEIHTRLSIDIMLMGLPVYTEKPPSISAAEARRMWEVSRKTGQVCMIGFKKRFAPVYRRAHEIVQSADFGAPVLLSINRSSGPYTNDPDQPTTWFLLDFAIHVIDLARFMFGEVEKIFAWMRDENTYAVNLYFANSALGTMALTAHHSWALCDERVEITSAGGQFIQIDNAIELRHYVGSEIRSVYRPNFSVSSGDSYLETGLLGELSEFVAAVREKRIPQSNIESAYRTMLLYDAIHQSAARGGEVCAISELLSMD